MKVIVTQPGLTQMQGDSVSNKTMVAGLAARWHETTDGFGARIYRPAPVRGGRTTDIATLELRHSRAWLPGRPNIDTAPAERVLEAMIERAEWIMADKVFDNAEKLRAYHRKAELTHALEALLGAS